MLTIGEQIAEVGQTPSRHGLARRPTAGAEPAGAGRASPTRATALQAYPHQLSGGQRQRVAHRRRPSPPDPRLLIADEPTSALDMVVQAEIVALLDQLVREDGMTLLFITHDIALASGFADRIAVFRRARLVEAGPATELLSPSDRRLHGVADRKPYRPRRRRR